VAAAASGGSGTCSTPSAAQTVLAQSMARCALSVKCGLGGARDLSINMLILICCACNCLLSFVTHAEC
jgi:hypothetical protein